MISYLNLSEIQRFHVCSLLNYGFVNAVDTPVFCIAFVLFDKLLLYCYANKGIELNLDFFFKFKRHRF